MVENGKYSLQQSNKFLVKKKKKKDCNTWDSSN